MKFDPTELGTIIDIQEFEENYGDIIDELPKLIDNFLVNCPKRFDAVAAAIEAKDSEKLRTSAHSLKGMLCQIFAVKSCEYSIQLELAGKAPEMGDITGLKIKLEAELQRLYGFLNGRKEEILSARKKTSAA